MHFFIAIRDYENDEPGPDLNAVGWTEQGAREKAADLDARLPAWAKKNPVIGIHVFGVIEVARQGGTLSPAGADR